MAICFTRDAMALLEETLSLPATGREQDWDLELADSSRTEEFISYIEEHRLDLDAKLTLMALILASLDDLTAGNGSYPSLDERVLHLLRQDRALYSDLAQRWQGSAHGDTEDDYAISPLVRVALAA